MNTKQVFQCPRCATSMEVDPTAAPFSGKTPAPDMVDEIADCLLEDHMALMTENAELRHKADKLNTAMYLLAKLRDEKYYPKGGYSSDIGEEWTAMLDSYYGEVRPFF